MENFMTNLLLDRKSRGQKFYNQPAFRQKQEVREPLLHLLYLKCVQLKIIHMSKWHVFLGGSILILITDFYVLLFLKLCKQDVMVQPFVFACKPSKMMFNSGFHKSILKAKQIKKASLLACLVFFLSLFLVFVFFYKKSIW